MRISIAAKKIRRAKFYATKASMIARGAWEEGLDRGIDRFREELQDAIVRVNPQASIERDEFPGIGVPGHQNAPNQDTGVVYMCTVRVPTEMGYKDIRVHLTARQSERGVPSVGAIVGTQAHATRVHDPDPASLAKDVAEIAVEMTR